MSLDDSLKEAMRQVLREELPRYFKPTRPDDKLLSAEEAGKILDVSANFLYSHASDYPFTVMLTNGDKKTVRFSANGIQKYLERKLKMQEAK